VLGVKRSFAKSYHCGNLENNEVNTVYKGNCFFRREGNKRIGKVLKSNSWDVIGRG